MKALLDKIDALILARCTKFSHRLQRATGLTCYFVAKIGVFLAGSSLLVGIVNRFVRILSYVTPPWVVAIFSLLLLSMIYKSVVLSRAEENIGEVKPSELLLYVNEKAFWRILWLVLACLDSGGFVVGLFHGTYRYVMLEWLDDAFFVGTSVFYYFVAVDPLPPGKSKVREWLEKFSAILKPVTIG